jgi:hypothetical protein
VYKLNRLSELADLIVFVAGSAPNAFPKFEHGPALTIQSEFERIIESLPLAKTKIKDEADYQSLASDIHSAYRAYLNGEDCIGAALLHSVWRRIK